MDYCRKLYDMYMTLHSQLDIGTLKKKGVLLFNRLEKCTFKGWLL